LGIKQVSVGTPTCLHLFYPVLRFTSQLSFLCPITLPYTDPDYRCLTIMAPIVLSTISPLHIRATLPFPQTALSCLRSSQPITERSNTQRHKYKEGNQDRTYIHTLIRSFTLSFIGLYKQKTHQGKTMPDYYHWSTVVV
jgi:hypothetical protein